MERENRKVKKKERKIKKLKESKKKEQVYGLNLLCRQENMYINNHNI